MEARQPIQSAVVVADAPGADLQSYGGLIGDAELRVGADGGAQHLLDAGFLPHIVIGDFDSLGASTLAELEARGVEIERHSIHKDETDLELALLHAIARGAHRIAVLAALGGRPDQHLANLQLLTHPALAAADVRLFHAGWEVFAIHRSAHLDGRPGQIVSLLPMSERVEGIVTEGLQYPLQDEALILGPARGVSNVMTSYHATVTIRSGILLAMHDMHELDDV